MQALVEHAKGYEMVLVVSNKPHAPGLDWARARGLPSWAWDSKGVDKEEFDRAMSTALDEHDVGTIALAGFMRILSPWFIDKWRGRVVNIHPSLLPKYRGLDTHKRALEAGDAVHGCSVHLVTEELDSGEVLGSAEVPILADRDVAVPPGVEAVDVDGIVRGEAIGERHVHFADYRTIDGATAR